jgi:hypothetical protein
MNAFAPAQRHGPIREVFPDVFVVRGSFRLAPLLTIPRNMIILREGSDLTLVNSVRLSVDGETELAKLGAVKHLVKLGHYHTLDDPYYRARFRPTFWAPAPADAETRELSEGGASPVERARPFRFDHARIGEAALLVEQPGGNLLVTCDSIQNWENTDGCSLVGGLVAHVMGFIEPAKVGPIWLKTATESKPAALWPDFARLLERDFAHLVGGHGVVLHDRARDAVARSCERSLGPRPRTT